MGVEQGFGGVLVVNDWSYLKQRRERNPIQNGLLNYPYVNSTCLSNRAVTLNELTRANCLLSGGIIWFSSVQLNLFNSP